MNKYNIHIETITLDSPWENFKSEPKMKKNEQEMNEKWVTKGGFYVWEP